MNASRMLFFVPIITHRRRNCNSFFRFPLAWRDSLCYNVQDQIGGFARVSVRSRLEMSRGRGRTNPGVPRECRSRAASRHDAFVQPFAFSALPSSESRLPGGRSVVPDAWDPLRPCQSARVSRFLRGIRVVPRRKPSLRSRFFRIGRDFLIPVPQHRNTDTKPDKNHGSRQIWIVRKRILLFPLGQEPFGGFCPGSV